MFVDSLARNLISRYGKSALPSKRHEQEDREGLEDDDEDASFENIEEPCRLPAYPYRELGETDVRLLRIVPGTGTIECLLHQMPLAEPRYFFALSYVWGNPEPQETIMLEGQPFGIGKNLYEALHQFRQRPYDIGHPRDYFWIDAICINQGDMGERSRQVQRMMEIYHAGLAIVWLGPIKEWPQDGLLKRLVRRTHPSRPRISRNETIKTLFEKADTMWTDWDPMDDDDNITIETEFGYQYSAMVREMIWMLGRPWFSRVWTIQEACLDAVPRFYVGPYSLHSTQFINLFDIIANKDTPIYLTKGGRRILSLKIIRRLYHSMGSGADDDPNNMELAELLCELLNSTNVKEATDARDQLYGLLGLLRHLKGGVQLPEELVPDYNLCYEQVYWNYSAFVFQTVGNLGLLGCRRRDFVQDAPSWVPDFRHLALGARKHPKKSLRLSPDKRILHLRGCILGNSHATIDGCVAEHIKPRTKALVAGLSRRLNEVEKRILKLSADIRGTTIEEIFGEMIKDVTRIIPEEGDEPFFQVYRRLSQFTGSQRSWTVKRKRTENVRLKEDSMADQFSSHFILLADGTILCMIREDATVRTSDLVCVLEGASSPCLLRATKEGYMFVGQCEAKSGPLKGQKFGDDFWVDREIQDFNLI
ncbi:HET-domain-containing protein [Hypoxylon sp. NC1633]|nr:HET-domain-containing protein [Hypoxylon sp. NC1633]